MATAYTAGLRVSPAATVEKVRRLPLRGEVLVQEGQEVSPDMVLARADRPGIMTTLKVAERLGIEPQALPASLQVTEGDAVSEGQLIAEHKSLFGLMTARVVAPHEGTVAFISTVTGNLGLRKPPDPLQLRAFLAGRVKKVLPGEGAVIEAYGAYVQGILGVGGEASGEMAVIATSAQEVVQVLPDKVEGKVLLAGAGVTDAVLEAIKEHAPAALVVGGLSDHQLTALLGEELGVAITGNENLATTIVMTEGFGRVSMASRTYEILASHEGEVASVSGATQIRAGVQRPEVFVPVAGPPVQEAKSGGVALKIGARIRLIRAPFFGRLGHVAALPERPEEIETGAKVRVLEAVLDDGSRVIVPRANVELFED